MTMYIITFNLYIQLLYVFLKFTTINYLDRNEYLPYCDEFDFYAADQADKQAGYIQEHGRTLAISQADALPHHCEHRTEKTWAIGRTLSKKVTFGWS